jgi:hypothetical protein
VSRVPDDPDAELDPKATLVNIARRSRKRAIVDGLVPRPGSGRKVGEAYAGMVADFVRATPRPWRPEVAALHSDSLRRCIAALETLKAWHPEMTTP